MVHNLSGPIAVEGAEPGDCLVVDILDSEFLFLELVRLLHSSPSLVNAFEKMPWGYTVRLLSIEVFMSIHVHLQGIFELENGGGLFGINNHHLKVPQRTKCTPHSSPRIQQQSR